MNSANEISHHTMLYGFIAQEAGQSSISAALNRTFKAKGKDAMMIPMNIRLDDFYYTVANMKKSHVNGAILSQEYTKSVVELLDDSSDIVKNCKICDILVREKDKLHGDLIAPFVLADFLKNRGVKRVALIGIDEYAKAFCFAAEGFEIAYFNDDLEALMNFCLEIKIKNPDVNRIADSMSVDFSSYDAVVDFSDFDNLDMVKKLCTINIDMKQKKAHSVLKKRAKELEVSYVGFEDMLDEYGSRIFGFLESKNHLQHDKSDMRF